MFIKGVEIFINWFFLYMQIFFYIMYASAQARIEERRGGRLSPVRHHGEDGSVVAQSHPDLVVWSLTGIWEDETDCHDELGKAQTVCKPFGAGSARRSHGPAERYAHVRHRCGSEPEHVSARKPFGAGWNEWVGCLEPLPTPTLVGFRG